MSEGTKPFINEEFVEKPVPVNNIETYCFSYEFTVDASNSAEAYEKAGQHLILKDWTEISKDPVKHLIWLDTFEHTDEVDLQF